MSRTHVFSHSSFHTINLTKIEKNPQEISKDTASNIHQRLKTTPRIQIFDTNAKHIHKHQGCVLMKSLTNLKYINKLHTLIYDILREKAVHLY